MIMMPSSVSAEARCMMIIHVTVLLLLQLCDGSSAGPRVTWSPDTQLQHLAVDPVSGKVTIIISATLSINTRSHPEMVGDMSHVTLNFDLSKSPFVHF